MAAILENGGHIEILRGPRFFSWKVTPVEYLCQNCCLYHNLNDSYSYLLCYWHKSEIPLQPVEIFIVLEHKGVYHSVC